MERLVYVIDAAITQRKWRPVPICRGGPRISNLIFADDLVLLAEASVEQACVIKERLNRFCQASGQKISGDKLQVIFSGNMNQDEVDNISEALDIPSTDDLGKYLGVPTLLRRVIKATFQYVIDRVKTDSLDRGLSASHLRDI